MILYDYIKKLPLHNFQVLRSESYLASMLSSSPVRENASHQTRPENFSSRAPWFVFGEERRNDVVSVRRLINPRGQFAY